MLQQEQEGLCLGAEAELANELLLRDEVEAVVAEELVVDALVDHLQAAVEPRERQRQPAEGQRGKARGQTSSSSASHDLLAASCQPRRRLAKLMS